MVQHTQVKEAVRLLVDASHPVKVIVFGSYARGEAHSLSDIDILVIEKHVGSKVREMVRLRRVLQPLKMPMDILVVSAKEVEEWGHLPGTALYWALKEGKIFYEEAA